MNRITLFIIFISIQIGCTTGEIIRAEIHKGMSKQQVISHLGNPDLDHRSGQFEALLYSERRVSKYSWDTTDYTIILKDEKVVHCGTGKLSYNNTPPEVYVPFIIRDFILIEQAIKHKKDYEMIYKIFIKPLGH